ncbi:MAG TPA: Ig-like domain-containing protein, partial [Prolixibacteraceae bacterium]|nr:Ig-like domain-containing protein [Prolixibacteraceae bacterium]
MLFTLGLANISKAQVSVTATVGTVSNTYSTLKLTFDAINAGTHKGVIDVKIDANTIETASAVLNASGTGAASYTAVNIYPTVSGLGITGDLEAPLIDLNGADNVTIDGRVNASGETKDLTISNASASAVTGTSAIRLINDACENTIKYCTLKGSSISGNHDGGIVYVAAGTVSGNNSNTIDNCNVTNAGGLRPNAAICIVGRSSIKNSNCTVSNSYIYDFLCPSKSSHAIYALHTHETTVINNSFYETTEFAATAAITHVVIYINNGGQGHNISNNYIGGSTNNCGGAPLTKTDFSAYNFTGIHAGSVDGPNKSNIQGNTIKNINWNSLGRFYGIYCFKGPWDVGNIEGNTIGAGTGTGSITFTMKMNSDANPNSFYGIYIEDLDYNSLVKNNIIGSITISNEREKERSDFCGIYNKSSGCEFSDNLIGSHTTANSIYAKSPSTGQSQIVYGMYDARAAKFNNNTVANLVSNCTNENAQILGMGGNVYGQGNIIHDLYGSGGTGVGNDASVIGIRGYFSTLSRNLIYNLYNSGSNTNVIGIFTYGGLMSNVIRIGSTASNASFYGICCSEIYNVVYNNSVYINGDVASINNFNSAAFVGASNGTRNYRNNIFVNARSNNAGGTGKNYAVMVTDNTALTMDYNDYYVSGTGGVLGSYNDIDVVDLAAWKTTVATDANSISADPLYANPAADIPDLNLNMETPCESTGIFIDNEYLTTDFSGQLRSNFTPTDMGAYCGDFAIIPVVISVLVPANGTYFVTQHLDFTVNFDNEVTVNVAGGTPSIPLTFNTGGKSATYLSGTGTRALVFRCTVVDGNYDPDGISLGTTIALNGATIKYALNSDAILTLNNIENTTGVLVDALPRTVSVTATAGTLTDSYSSLKLAFDTINAGTHKGDIIIKIVANTTETASAVLNASGTGAASYTAVNIYPTVSGLSITGNLAAPLIDLNGADNVTIDGRVNATGDIKDLTISNTSTATTAGTSTIRLINDASENTIEYCTLNGSSTAELGLGGIVYLAGGITTGNNSNTIDHCNVTNAGGLRPTHGVCSNGVSTDITNNKFTVSNSYVYDFLCHTKDSYAIYTSNTSECTVTNNSFYETTEFATTEDVSQHFIYINTGGGGHNISDNYIGGSTNNCGGTALTKTNFLSRYFYGIWVDGNATASNIQGNTIQNINWRAVHDFYGIYLKTGLWNIGTIDGNVIGAETGTGSITYTVGGSSQRFYGIFFDTATSGSLAENNIIGSITVSNDLGMAAQFYGIYNGKGKCVFTNNLIGSNTTPKSINATSTSTTRSQSVCGMLGNTANGGSKFNNNTVANLFNACTHAAAQTTGISGYFNAKNNTIHDLYGSGGTGTGNGSSIVGIRGGSSSGNLIYNLFNSGSNTIVIGIHTWGETINNVIRIGTTASNATFYGISDIFNYEIYNNSVYINGNVASTNNANSAAFVSTSNGSRNYRNNIFVNTRSNMAGGTGKNYAAMVTDNTALTMDYNDYYVSGTGGVFGSYSNIDVDDLATWQTTVWTDANSINADPLYVNPTAAIPDLNLTVGTPCEGTGIYTSYVKTDYSGQLRSDFTPTDMGAYCGNFALGPIVTSVSVPSNKTYGADQYLDFTVNFDLDVNVNVTDGKPSIPVTLNTGGTVAATYLSGTGTKALVFRYIIESGVNDPDGISLGAVIALNGSIIKDTFDRDAILTLNNIGNTTAVLIDAIAPTALITMNDNALRIGETTTTTFTFSEKVIGFSNADLSIANGTLTTVSSSDDGITWTATFTPTNNLEVATNEITLDLTGITDLIGNAGVGTTSSPNYAIDTKRPVSESIVLSNNAFKIGETALLTFTFSEAITGFTNADLTIANGTLSAVSSADGITWTGTFTPTDGLEAAINVITIDNTAYTDIAGNTGVGTNNSANYTMDTKVPSVLSINRADDNPTFASSADFTVTFSESVTGVGASDFSLTTTGSASGTVSAISGSEATYAITVNAISGVGDIRLDLNNSGTGIADIVTNPIATGYTGGQTYTIYQAPTVTTNAAQDMTSMFVNIFGTFNANGNNTTATFDYGTTTSYGSTVAFLLNPIVGTTNIAVSCTLNYLIPFTTYHYRAVGENTAGTTNGLDETFKTLKGQLSIIDPLLTLSRAYDGTDTAAVTAGELLGVHSADFGNVTVSAQANYDDANAGTDKTITVVYTISGSESYKYIKPVDHVISTGEITPKDITVTVDAAQTKVYDQSDPVFTYTSNDALATFTGLLNREAGENVGEYAITKGTLVADANWNIATFNSADFSITPKDITVTASAAQTKVYDQTDPVFTYSSSDVLATFTGLAGRVAGENVG